MAIHSADGHLSSSLQPQTLSPLRYTRRLTKRSLRSHRLRWRVRTLRWIAMLKLKHLLNGARATSRHYLMRRPWTTNRSSETRPAVPRDRQPWLRVQARATMWLSRRWLPTTGCKELSSRRWIAATRRAKVKSAPPQALAALSSSELRHSRSVRRIKKMIKIKS